MVINMELREYRFELGLSQKEASIATGVPLRTYIRYENDNAYGNQLKRKQMIASLVEKYQITEEKGILKIEYITKKVETVLVKYGEKINFCYLFGSYAKGYANDFSDVDLCVSTTLTGLSHGLFFVFTRSPAFMIIALHESVSYNLISPASINHIVVIFLHNIVLGGFATQYHINCFI